MIFFPAVVVNHILGISVILSVVWCVVFATDTNGLTFQYLDEENTILQLVCDGRGVAINGANLSIAIYNMISMDTLAQMTVGKCPWTEGNRLTGQVYTLVCLLPNPDPLPVLKIIVTDVDKSCAPKFRCNVTDLAITSTTPVVTWTITAHRSDPTVPMEHRTAASKQKSVDTPSQTPDSSFSVYVMGFAILSLALGLVAALFYIGLQMLRSRRNSDNVSGDRRTGRSNGNSDAIDEVIGDSGPDSGCERSLMCPNGAFRRPSYYQDYTEPMSPTPSTVSDYAGMDFLQIQLSDTLVTAPNLRLPRKNFTKNSIKSNSVPFDTISEHSQETVGNSTYIKTRDILQGKKEVKNGCSRCLESAIVVVEYTATEILEFSDDDLLLYLRSYI